jgi:Ca2+-binding EF-hand superfamily protein
LGEPLTAFSKSIFRLADMDDSGLIDFAEFVKVRDGK